MLRASFRAVAPGGPRGLLARAMSSKLVATVTGPADKDALSTFTRTVMGQGVTLGSSRSMEVSGTLSIASVLFLPDKLAEKGAIESVSALQWALQANLAGFICSVRPARVGRASRVIARVHVSGVERMGILAELASHCESRGVRVATMRTQTDSSRYGADGIEGNDDDDEPLYTCVCTLATHEVRPAPLRALGVTPGPAAGRRGSLPPRFPRPSDSSCTPAHAALVRCTRGPCVMRTWPLGCSGLLGGAESMGPLACGPWAILCALTEAPSAAIHLTSGHGACPRSAPSLTRHHPRPALALPSPGHERPATAPPPPPPPLGRSRLPTGSTHPAPCSPQPAPFALHPAPPSGGRGCRVDPSGAL